MRPSGGLGWSHRLCLLLLLWSRRTSGPADFSNYLSRIITNHYTHACERQPLRLHCPRHSTISIQWAFYGSGGMWLCRADPHRENDHNQSCSSSTALQMLLSECQSRRRCQLPVNHLLFGEDPCPGSSKSLHVHYKCKPTDHKRRLACEGETMVLRCKPPRVLDIYAAVYDTCPSHVTSPPPVVCQNHDAVRVVTQACYSRQKCTIAVNNQTFRDPCFPGTKKSLSVLYSCVPMTSLTEAELVTSYTPTDTGKAPPTDVEQPVLKGSERPENTGTMMSNSLQTYAYIKDHPEMAALLFTSSVCVGLLLTLLAVSLRVTCRRRTLTNQNEGCQSEEDEDDDADDDNDNVAALISATERKSVCGWEDGSQRSEAAERTERIERRDMIIQEIRMNAYLNGNSC